MLYRCPRNIPVKVFSSWEITQTGVLEETRSTPSRLRLNYLSLALMVAIVERLDGLSKNLF